MSRENVELATLAIEALARRAIDSYDDLYAPDLQWFPAGPLALQGEGYAGYRGREGLETVLFLFAGSSSGSSGLAFVSDFNRTKRQVRTFYVELDDPGQPAKVMWARSSSSSRGCARRTRWPSRRSFAARARSSSA